MNDFIKVSDIMRYEIKLKGNNGEIDRYIPATKVETARKYDVRNNIKSYWTIHETENKLEFSCTCNNCNQTTKKGAFTIAPDYCPFCGAVMIDRINK